MRWKFFLFPRSVIWHPKRLRAEGWTLNSVGRTGRKEQSSNERRREENEQKRNTVRKKTTPWLRHWRWAGCLRVSKITGCPPQMISKGQVSLFTGGWVTFLGALWGGDDEEFQQQSPSQQPPDSQPHQRAKQQKVQLTRCFTVAIFLARLWFLHGYAFLLLFRLPFLPAERRTP